MNHAHQDAAMDEMADVAADINRQFDCHTRCSGPCNQVRSACKTPTACQLAEEQASGADGEVAILLAWIVAGLLAVCSLVWGCSQVVKEYGV